MAGKLTFTQITGQTQIVGHLQNALRTGEVSHAYIFCGAEGSGKEELAYVMAAALECTDLREVDGLLEPCGKCHSCLQMDTGSQPDVITVLPQKENKSNALQVDDARAMRDDVQIKPYSSRWKVYIVPNADRMNVQAQNALLKTLEEPPFYAVIILLAENTQGFLPTVLSRCIVLRLHDVDEKLIRERLEEEGADEKQALLAARASHGNPGRARQMVQEPAYEEFRRRYVALLRRIAATDTYTFLQEAAALGREHFDAFLDMSQSWLRDICVVKSTGKADALIFQDEAVYIRNAAEVMSWRDLQAAADAVDLALQRRRANGNEEQILEMLMLSLRVAMRRTKKIS